jgi:hypothetical protein
MQQSILFAVYWTHGVIVYSNTNLLGSNSRPPISQKSQDGTINWPSPTGRDAQASDAEQQRCMAAIRASSSITLSARDRGSCMVSPSIFAVLRLTTH